MNADAPREPSPPPLRPGGARVTSIVGALSALALGVCFFLAWVAVDPSLGERLRADVERALEDVEAPTAPEQGLGRLTEMLVSQGGLSGTDLIFWVRTAQAYNAQLDAEAGAVASADEAMRRRLWLLRLLFYSLPTVGFLLAAYFLFHRLRRVRSPVLILCLLAGALAFGLAAALEYGHALVLRTVGGQAGGVRLDIGHTALQVAGAGLLLAGIFGVGRRNWFRVYAGSLLTAGAIALLAWRYLEKGWLP